jgi:hypothetical protein
MASFSAGTTFSDGVANDVTAAKLGALVNNATPTSGLIQDRTTETIVGSTDTFLIGDASDSNNLKKMTVANVMKAQLTGTINTTAGTITTLNSSLLTTGTGTASAPAIAPSSDTNTGIFFPAADTIALAEGGTEVMRIDSSGNVGIGATSMSQKLVVVGGSSDTETIRIITGSQSGIQQTTGLGFAFSTGATHPSVLIQAEEFDTADQRANIILSTNNTNTDVAPTERLRIDSSGNVGIGTASPAVKLHVDGSARVGSGNDYQFDSTLKINGESTGATGYLRFYTNSLERLRIDSDGNVGIGTTSPSQKLVVVGATSDTETIRIITGSASGTQQATGIGFAFSTTATHPSARIQAEEFDATDLRADIIFSTNNTNTDIEPSERMRISSAGNVSIGTATALSTLHVHGNITLSNTTTATSAGTSTLTPPATVAGYLTVSINGTSRKIPYYAT